MTSEIYYELREKEVYKFSVELFESKEYYRAITEAKRYISIFPEGKNLENMYKLIGDSYLMAREWSDAIDAYNEFIIKFSTSRQINQVMFNKAICLVKKKDYEQAKITFQEIIDSAEPQDKSRSILWKILLLIQENKFKEIEELLSSEVIRMETEDKRYFIDKIIYYKKHVRYKSPKLAATMSAILPGSGQLYNERYKDGIYSFILNALFILGTYFAFDDENYGLAGALTIFEAGWYTGNIYSAANGAHKYNRKIDEDVFRKSVESFELLEHEIRQTPNMSIFFRFYF